MTSWISYKIEVRRTILDMQAPAMSEAHLRMLNGQRLAILKTLVEETERATEPCDAWLGSGHIADYRKWQTRLRSLEEADAQYQGIRQNIADTQER
ncbi:MAG: hypothetical protein ACR2IV_08690 [Bryobacteraceae bacterium]